MWLRSFSAALASVLVSPALAAPAPTFSDLGAYPILQFFGGLMVFAVGLIMYLRGEKERKQRESNPETGVKMFFDGPLVEFNSQIRRLADGVEKLTSLALAAVPAKEEIAERIANVMRELREVRDKNDTFDKRLREVENLCARLDERGDHRPRR